MGPRMSRLETPICRLRVEGAVLSDRSSWGPPCYAGVSETKNPNTHPKQQGFYSKAHQEDLKLIETRTWHLPATSRLDSRAPRMFLTVLVSTTAQTYHWNTIDFVEHT